MARSRLTRRDAWIAILLFAVSLAGYAALVLRLAQGRYYEYYNLAFDFDAVRMLNLLTAFPADAFGFKHPFMLLFRPLGLALLTLGLPAKLAAGLVMAAVGAARVALVYMFLRAAAAAGSVAAALALLFAVTGTQLTTAMVPETYGFALLSLIVVWLIAQLRLPGPSRIDLWRYPAAIVTAGITITNAVQPTIAEFLAVWRRWGLRGVAPRMVLFSVVCGLGFAAVALALWPAGILAGLRDPVRSVKAIWWLQTKGETTGLSKVLETFLGFSFVSPHYTVMPLPETTRMLDFREWSFPFAGQLAAAAWLVFVGVGTVAGLIHKGYRPMALALLATLALNVAFHLDFQFRSSVYIYAAHTHFLVFALASGVAPWLAGRVKTSIAYIASVLALTGLLAAVNVPSAANFTTRFDVPDTACPAPCNDGLLGAEPKIALQTMSRGVPAENPLGKVRP